MTLVGYFNSLRELGGTRRLVDDDIRSRLRSMDERGLARRTLRTIEELTSRKGSTDIPLVLDHLEVPFDPTLDPRRADARRRGEHADDPVPIDVLLATNMLSVGVDVKRLGLMVVAGQPKTTAEYIQATSRVGRSFPGLVCTVYGWTRPRDLSHYEQFEHYHATFYQHVEALSVTPFARRAVDRGLTAVLTSLIRLAGVDFNENARAQGLERAHPLVTRAIEVIARRVSEVRGDTDFGDEVRAMMQQRLDLWLRQAQGLSGGARLGYKEKRDGVTRGLLRPPKMEAWTPFTCLHSLREVEPMVNLMLALSTSDLGPAADAAAPVDGDHAQGEVLP
jgi:hypothetical protein